VSTHPADPTSNCLGSKVVERLLERIAAIRDVHLLWISARVNMRRNSERVAKKRLTQASRTRHPEWGLPCRCSELNR